MRFLVTTKCFDVMGDALKSEREAKNDLVKTLADSTPKLSEQQTDFLKTRLIGVVGSYRNICTADLKAQGAWVR